MVISFKYFLIGFIYLFSLRVHVGVHVHGLVTVSVHVQSVHVSVRVHVQSVYVFVYV